MLVLTAATADTVVSALLYVAVFGLGSVIGMAALSLIASYPTMQDEKKHTEIHLLYQQDLDDIREQKQQQ